MANMSMLFIGGAEHELAEWGSASNGLDTKVFDTEEKRHMAVKDPSLFPDVG
jgi:hypothetical protein